MKIDKSIVYNLPRPVYVFLKFLRDFFSNAQIYYEARIAPFLTVYAGWVFWPVYKLLAALNIYFVANIGEATGHIVTELDSFFRKQKLNKIDNNKRYVWIRKNTPLSKACVQMYRHKFWFASSSTFIYNLLFPLIIRYKSITLDCGYGGYKWQLPDGLNYNKTKYGQKFWYLYKLSKTERDRDYMEYAKLRFNSQEYFPLSEGKHINADNELIGFLSGGVEKLALIHIKDQRVNGTAEPTSPATYGKALQYLIDQGYRLVFVGREKMPDEFLRYKIVNYANSGIATFKHDIQLFMMAKLAITGGSGISWLADCLDKPYLYLNSWFLNYNFQSHSKRCIIVPALVQKYSGELLKFSEQIDLYKNLLLSSEGPDAFPEGQYKGRNASDDEILAGAQELIAPKEPSSQSSLLQERFRKLDVDSMFWVSSRISGYFLQKYAGLL